MNRVLPKTQGIVGAIVGALVAIFSVIFALDFFVFEESLFEHGILIGAGVLLSFLLPMGILAISSLSKDGNRLSK